MLSIMKAASVFLRYGQGRFKKGIVRIQCTDTKNTDEHSKRQRGRGQMEQAYNERQRRRIREQRRRERQKRKLMLLLWKSAFFVMAVLLIWDIGLRLGTRDQTSATEEEHDIWTGWSSWWQGGEEGSYANSCGLDKVDAPVKRSVSEVLARLQELGREDERIAQIAENAGGYPDNMLEALANNPEMADFVAGYPDADGTVTGGLTEEERAHDCPLLLQWDPRWGYVSYGDDSNIGLAGCGPTALAMVLYGLTKDEGLTPDTIAAYAMSNGYYMSGSGTRWALMDELPGRYGVAVSNPALDEEALKQALNDGALLILAMRAGDFTTAGHFIVIYGYGEDGFWVNDPNCVARSRRSWTFSELRGQIKQIWAYQVFSPSGFKS